MIYSMITWTIWIIFKMAFWPKSFLIVLQTLQYTVQMVAVESHIKRCVEHSVFNECREYLSGRFLRTSASEPVEPN